MDDEATSRCQLGLALSGGGFRATLFGLGSLWRLNDGGWLPKLDRITSVSGGSIAAAYLGFKWRALRFDAQGVASNFAEEVATPLRAFCGRCVDVPAVVTGLLHPFQSIADRVAARYESDLFRTERGQGATLQELPAEGEGPRFIIYATCLQTGASFRFSQPYLADYRLGRVLKPTVRLALAVAASSAFPPFLSPVTLRTDPETWIDRPSPDQVPESDRVRRRLLLTDGGVYDNMGVEAVFDRCETVLVSDAGAPFRRKATPWTNWASQLGRVRDIMMAQTRALRRRMVVGIPVPPRLRTAYWGIASSIDGYRLSDAMAKDTAASDRLRNLPTRLRPFSEPDPGALINWGYALADAALRTYVAPGSPPGRWPCPEHKFSGGSTAP